jgi:hypothetical protein
MDLRGNIPCSVHITEGKTHDVKLLDELVLEPGVLRHSRQEPSRLSSKGKPVVFI